MNIFPFQSGEPREVTAEQVELFLADPGEDWDVVKDDPDFLVVGEKKVGPATICSYTGGPRVL